MSQGELSSLTATMEELGRRIAALADQRRTAGDDDSAIDLDEIERSVRTAVRRLSKLVDRGRNP